MTICPEAYRQVLASLVAAVSILKRADEMKVRPSKAVASDVMFAQMISDYEAAIESGCEAFRHETR